MQKLIPSGCSQYSKQTVASTDNRFAYAGDSHVYIYSEQSYKLEKIIPFCDHSVTHIQFHPKISNILACVTMEPQLEIWDIDKGQMQMCQKLQSEVSFIDWNKEDPNQMIIVFASNELTDDLRIMNLQTQKLMEIVPAYSEVSIGKWHPRSTTKFVAGCKDGTIYFCHADTKKVMKSHGDHNAQIVDIAWNLSEDLLIILYIDGNMRLYAFDVPEPQLKFEKQATGISSVQWIDTMSGDLITSTSKVGALRLWNAAHDCSKDMLKVGPHGIISITPSKTKQGKFFLQFKSGQIIVYNALKRKILFQTDIAHSSQVQRVKINPNNSKQMASIGYDGTIRIWNLETMKMITVIEDKVSKNEKDQKINAIAWQAQPQSPSEEILIIGTGSGTIKIVDVKKNKISLKLDIAFGHQIFDIDWSPYGIIIACEDKKIYFCKYEDGKLLSTHTIVCSDSVRAVSWNPIKMNIAAAGLFNGKIQIIDADKFAITQELSSPENKKILALAWHPNFEYILASGSSDNSAKVWDIKNNGHKNLLFHTGGVRSVAWNYEIPWLLLTGGDDQNLAAWDIRENKLISEYYEASISVSSIASHPLRPFTIVTSHFDNSIIFWDLLGFKDIFQAQMKYLLGLGLLEITCDSHDQMTINSSGKLSGEASKNLLTSLKKSNQYEKLSKIIQFFNTQEGDLEFQNMISIMSGKGPLEDADSSQVLHISDSAQAFQSRAQQLLQVSGLKMLGTSLSKKEDRLKEAANLMLKSGNFQDYCEIQISLGNYEVAIATAPKVSLKYWQSCINQYLEYLENYKSQKKENQDSLKAFDPEEERITYLLLLNKTSEAASLLHSRGETQEAKLIKTLSLKGDFISNPLTNHESINNQQKFLDINDLNYSIPELNQVTVLQSQKKFDQNIPILAASIHLSLSDPKKAIQKLVLSNNLEYAYVVSQLFDKSSQDQILTLLYHKLIQLESSQIAFKFLQQMNNPTLKSVLEASFEVMEEENDDEEKKSPSNKNYSDSCDIIGCLVAKDLQQSSSIALMQFQCMFVQSLTFKIVESESVGFVTKETYEAFYLLGQFDLVGISLESFRSLISCYITIGLVKALYFQQFDMMKVLGQIQLPVKNVIHSKMLYYLQFNNQQLLQLATGEGDKFIKDSFIELQKFLSQYMPIFEQPGLYKHICPYNSSKIERNVGKIQYSELTGDLIKTKPAYQLEEHQKVVNKEEALDLALLMPFSPMSMTYRRRIIPF